MKAKMNKTIKLRNGFNPYDLQEIAKDLQSCSKTKSSGLKILDPYTLTESSPLNHFSNKNILRNIGSYKVKL